MLSSRYLHLHAALGLGPMWLRQGVRVEDAAASRDPAAPDIPPKAMADTPPASTPAHQARRALLSALHIGDTPATPPHHRDTPATRTTAPLPEHADWAALPQWLNDCTRCPLHTERRTPLPGHGPTQAPLLIISPNPAPQDDLSGQLLSGEAGVLLHNMLTAAGIDPAQAYYTSQVKCTPNASIHPGADARAACLVFLQRQLAWLQPKAVLLLGQDFQAHPPLLASVLGALPYVIVPHPARLLRQGVLKAQAWPALQTLAAHLAA